MQLPALVAAITAGAEQRDEAAHAAREKSRKKHVTPVAVAPRQKSDRAAGKVAARQIRAQIRGAHASDKDEDEYSISTGGMQLSCMTSECRGYP